jgi:thiamine transport system substrate-binding protein
LSIIPRRTALFAGAALLALCALPVAPARADDATLTVYTYDGFNAEWGPGPQITKAFEATCSCKIKWVETEDAVSILTRLQLEGASSPADVALGLDLNLTADAASTGLFAPRSGDLPPLTLPVVWKDPVFVPFDFGYFAFVYDSEKIKNPPQSLDELINGKDTYKVLLEDPRTSTPGLGFLLWMKALYGDQAPVLWQKLNARTLTTSKSWSEAYGLFTKGEAPMVLSYTTSPAYHITEEGTDRYKTIAFKEGNYLQVEVAGRLKNAPHPDLADKFLAFVTAKEFQAAIPATNWMYPVRDVPMPDSFNTLPTPKKVLLTDPEVVRDNRKAWTAEWLDAISR